MRQPAVERETATAATKATATAMADGCVVVWYVCSVTRNWLIGRKRYSSVCDEIIGKNTVPVTMGSP